MEYKNTIITPQTKFPMKAGLPAREPGMLKAWEEQGLYQAMKRPGRSANRFQRAAGRCKAVSRRVSLSPLSCVPIM